MRRFKLANLILIGLLMLAPALAVAQSTKQATGEEIVYITKTGKKYHRKNCSTLHGTKIPIKVKDAVKNGYTPCKICHPPTLPKK